MNRAVIILISFAAVVILDCGPHRTGVSGPANEAGLAAADAPASIRMAVLSPDTGAVAFTTGTSSRQPEELWIVGTNPDSEPWKVATGLATQSAPAWSPDGQLLAFQALADGVLQLWIWDRQRREVRQVTRIVDGIRPNFYTSVVGNSVEPGLALRLGWSPDSRHVVFSSRVSEPPAVLGDSIPIVLTETSPAPRIWAGILPHTSGGWHYENGVPTKRTLTDSSALRAGDEIVQLFIADVGNGDTRQLTSGRAGGFDADWSPDGTNIVLVSGEGAPMLASRLRATNIHLIDVASGQRRSLTSDNGRKYSPTWSQDGQTVAFQYRADEYAAAEVRLLDIAAGTVLKDTMQVAAVLRDAFPAETLQDLLRVSGGARIDLHPPWEESPRRLVDWTPPDELSAERDETETMQWTSTRGAQIKGRIRYPQSFQPGRRYPLVIDPYGEWQTPDTLTAAGYLVFAPSPRAPHSPGDNSAAYRELSVDSPAIALDIMVQDVMSGVDTLVQRGLVDPSRMALVGFSNGGGVVNYLVTRTTAFRCAVAQSPAGSGDWATDMFIDPDGEYKLAVLNGAAPWDVPSTYVTLSPTYVVDRIQVPMLYAIGDMEGMTYVTSALYMYAGLRRLGRPVTLIRYPGQGHGLRGWALDDLATRARQFIDDCTK